MWARGWIASRFWIYCCFMILSMFLFSKIEIFMFQEILTHIFKGENIPVLPWPPPPPLSKKTNNKQTKCYFLGWCMKIFMVITFTNISMFTSVWVTLSLDSFEKVFFPGVELFDHLLVSFQVHCVSVHSSLLSPNIPLFRGKNFFLICIFCTEICIKQSERFLQICFIQDRVCTENRKEDIFSFWRILFCGNVFVVRLHMYGSVFPSAAFETCLRQ